MDSSKIVESTIFQVRNAPHVRYKMSIVYTRRIDVIKDDVQKKSDKLHSVIINNLS